ncbi:hypothetical protein FOL47_003676 [Perkinsus chesapeaki]|uniref:Dehydrogenase reductase SDR member 7B n=1 Tax=Perkinsus chesapeaki TaxID=330153 RepID=A0A7J6M811_PERCH|nr:hypothetical protein FOL47_003676 [Perkinsus chesapeaki]
MSSTEDPLVLSMGGFPFTVPETLLIAILMVLAAPFIIIGIIASAIVHMLQYPLRNLGYTQKLAPVRPSRSQFAVITGASKGLGREVALKLARDGWSLVIAARDLELLNSLKGRIQAEFGEQCKVIVVACDLSTDKGRSALENAVNDLPVTLAVLNAGGAYTRDLVNVTEQKIHSMLGINVEQQTYLSHAKSYLSQFGRSLTHECRSLGCGVLTIQPGGMNDTNFSTAGDCNDSIIFKFPGASMRATEVAEEMVRRLQSDDPNQATGCHTVGLLNKLLVAAGPYLSDNLAGFVARFVLFGPETKYIRDFTARESKVVKHED